MGSHGEVKEPILVSHLNNRNDNDISIMLRSLPMQEKEILIIDDDEDLSFIISVMLESYGYVVTCA